MGESVEFYDSTRLIAEVQKRPAIYDKNSIEYKNKDIRDKMWRDICESIIPNWSQQDEKHKVSTAREVQRKWKNIRDCFKKELNNDKKCQEGLGKRKRRKYIFYDHLVFLLPYMNSTDNKGESSSLKHYSSGEEGDDVNEEGNSESDKTKRIRWTHGAQQHPIYLYKDPGDSEPTGQEYEEREPDEDKYFLLSLLPALRNLSADQKFQAKIEFLQTLRNLSYSSFENVSVVAEQAVSEEPHTNFDSQITKEEPDKHL